MTAALVAAWVGAFVAPVCIELLKMFAIHQGWYPSQPATPPPQSEETKEILEEIHDVLRGIDSKVGERLPALTDTLEDLSQGVGRLTELGEARSRESGVLIYQHTPVPPVPGAAAHPVDG
ncbi:hypothetical protein G7Y89_g2067 [Cudoniella acicularis]|uniref:Uncharacterized protein n=1 Tax=Cudoniella acicularis TaxID=354080 RepID=A0A8H4RU42_9HELO|nr:hypothetical protein G7Y89_g2067 [Cudoniella acicularis]